jgi:hypothetical protein
VRAAVWLVCLVWVAGVAGLYMLTLFGAPPRTVIAEASLAATACFWVIFPYVCARALDGATRRDRPAP